MQLSGRIEIHHEIYHVVYSYVIISVRCNYVGRFVTSSTPVFPLASRFSEFYSFLPLLLFRSTQQFKKPGICLCISQTREDNFFQNKCLYKNSLQIYDSYFLIPSFMRHPIDRIKKWFCNKTTQRRLGVQIFPVVNSLTHFTSIPFKCETILLTLHTFFSAVSCATRLYLDNNDPEVVLCGVRLHCVFVAMPGQKVGWTVRWRDW